ncbi:MAG: ADP-ribosylglycohydrolase family protein [Planctomycetota bacterium]|jgi:hypothetical protein
MRKLIVLMVTVGFILSIHVSVAFSKQQKFRRLPVKEYRDKMKAGWIGQMAGVAWGYPIEFRYYGRFVPKSMVPKWKPNMVNDAFTQDDLYLDIGYLHSIHRHGLDISSRQVAIDRAGYDFEFARGSRASFISGPAPPDSGHPRFRNHPDGLGYQIAADVTGLIAPGLPNFAIALGEQLGSVRQYGDGIYAGQFVGALYCEAFFESDPVKFVGALYCEAFFESDPVKIVEAALKAIPQESTFAEMVRDVLTWYKQEPDDWERAYQLIDEKYFQNKKYNWMDWKWKGLETLNMDVKLNGAFILTGLLYGQRDLNKTIIYSMRGGHDCDCNPSNSAGVLFTTIGFSKLPSRFTSIDKRRFFSQVEDSLLFQYTLPEVIELTEKIAREAIVQSGGRIEKEANGEEVFLIPLQVPRPSKLQQSQNPGPIANSRFTAEEMAQIRGTGPLALSEFKKHLPGWKVSPESSLGLLQLVNGRKNVFVTYPPDKKTQCSLTKQIDIPADLQTILRLKVGHDPRGGYTLIVKANGKELYSWDVVKEPWLEIAVDLSEYAGKSVTVELINKPSKFWSNEWAYFKQIAFESRMTFDKGETLWRTPRPEGELPPF